MRVKERLSVISEKARVAALPVTTAAMVAVPTVCSWAADASGDFDINTVTTTAMKEVSTTMLFVIGAAATASVGVACATVGVDYVIKRIKTLKKAG